MYQKNITPEDILDLIQSSPAPLTKREIIAALGIKGEETRQLLKRQLRDLEKDGKIVKQPGQAYAIPDALPLSKSAQSIWMATFSAP
jgi:ribonuclease R